MFAWNYTVKHKRISICSVVEPWGQFEPDFRRFTLQKIVMRLPKKIHRLEQGNFNYFRNEKSLMRAGLKKTMNVASESKWGSLWSRVNFLSNASNQSNRIMKKERIIIMIFYWNMHATTCCPERNSKKSFVSKLRMYTCLCIDIYVELIY